MHVMENSEDCKWNSHIAMTEETPTPWNMTIGIGFHSDDDTQMTEQAIRFAHYTESVPIQCFIDRNWRKDHVLAKRKGLLDWQYLDKKNDRYNFVVAPDSNGKFRAILGFIPLSHFDDRIPQNDLIWLAIWQVTEECAGQKLGKLLLDHLQETIRPKIIAANAISGTAAHRYRQNGWHIDRLGHYFIPNTSIQDHRLIVPGKPKHPECGSSIAKLETIPNDIRDWLLNIADVNLSKCEASKTAQYIVNRYLYHPFYRYTAWRVWQRRRCLGILITRTCMHNGATALRIVEYFGPPSALYGLGDKWQRILRTHSHEYVDFYLGGIDPAFMSRCGFSRREEGDGWTVPDYYEPFARRNVEIDTMVSIQIPGMLTFKGDSDQDRPNIL